MNFESEFAQLEESGTKKCEFLNVCDQEDLKRIVAVAKNHQSLRHLRFVYSQMWSGGSPLASGIYDILKCNRLLHTLHVEEYCCDGKAMEAIAQGLKVNNTLRTLDLHFCSVGNDSIKYLADALLENTSLRDLDLGNNLIGHEGVEALVCSMERNHSLTSLCLSGNREIGDIGAGYLGDLIKNNHSLGTLVVSGCGIGKLGGLHIANGLEKNTTLTRLMLWGLSDPLTSSRIRDYLGRNTIIQRNRIVEALKSDRKGRWNRARIMFVGAGKAGKTATVRALLGEPFSACWESTIGASLSESQTSSSNWEETDSENFARHFVARIMVNESSERQEQPSSFMDENTYGHATSKLAHALEKENSIASPKGTRRLPCFSGMSTGEVVPLMNRANREESEDTVLLALWDFAGQDVFYAMHHLFLTKTGVYLLVFDIRSMLQPGSITAALSYIKFWTNSIKMHAPKAALLLVATFCRGLNTKDAFTRVQSALAPLLKQFPNVVQNERDLVGFFPIDNEDHTGVDYLRSVVENVARRENANAEEIPVSWLLLLDQVLLQKKSHNYLRYAAVKDMASSNGVLGATELDQALSLFHDRGMIVHLTATEVLRGIVTINPQWLINCLSSVIRDSSLHPFDLDEIYELGLEKDEELLFQQALASRDILEYVWKNDQVEFLISLMEHLMLLSPWDFDKDELYLIPSLLNKKNTEQNILGIRCVFDFSSKFLPNGVFQRLVCLCVAYCGSQVSRQHCDLKEPKLYKNCAYMMLSPDFEITLLEETSFQCISIFMDPEFACKTLTLAQSMLQKLNADVMGSGLHWDTFLEDTNIEDDIPIYEKKFVPYETAKAKCLTPWFSKDVSQNTELSSNVDLLSFLDGLQ